MTFSGAEDSIWAVFSMALTICYYILGTIFTILFLAFEVVIGHTIIYYAVHGRWEEDDRARKDVPADSTTASISLKDTESPNDTEAIPTSDSATTGATSGDIATSTPPPQKSDSEITAIGFLSAVHVFLAVSIPFCIMISREGGKRGSATLASNLTFGAMVASVVLAIFIGVEFGCFWTYRVGNRYFYEEKEKEVKVD